MSQQTAVSRGFFLALLLVVSSWGFAGELEPPKLNQITVSKSERKIDFTPYPGAEGFKILKADNLIGPFVEDTSGILSGYSWKAPVGSAAHAFYRLQVVPLNSDALFATTVLNRLAYGPTPDELERVLLIGPQAYINEQLAPELINEDLDFARVILPSGWQYVTASGTGSRSVLYIYLSAIGEGYIDDVRLVEGNVAGAGPNLLRNGDFESPLAPDWTLAANHSGSRIVTDVSHSGNQSLLVVASSPGEGDNSSIYQTITPALSNSKRYTISYWYLPSGNPARFSPVTVRLSGSGVVASLPLTLGTKLAYGSASITELQSWFILHAIQSKRQLLEVLTQFFDNHFTTFFTKSRDYIDGRMTAEIEDIVAADFEFRELAKWRGVLLNPNGTFYDLLKISADSPAMVIYLDTVTSRRGAANENYARELMELFTMGVDNGYDQKDIEEMSRAWTGWQVEKLPLAQANNPFAARVPNREVDPGIWTLSYRTDYHDTTAKTIFAGKTVSERFGAPWAGKSYELKLPARTGTEGMKDGYDIITHLANLPYTQEYISVKLCQLFIHENFHHGVYDYTKPDLSPEAKLVRDCMAAWETPGQDGRKGNLRNVLRVIFSSDLFRQHAASRQKVKTPFEFTVSTIRSLRMPKTGGGFTAESTGSDLIDPMNRIGMRLFYREEPDGWPEAGKEWISTSSLVERMRFVQNFLRGTKADPVSLIKAKLPSAQWRDPAAVTDYLLSILFPGEGKANLDLDRFAAIGYLNANDAGVPDSSPFNRLDPNSQAYSLRVRSLTAMLMGLPRFQEQ